MSEDRVLQNHYECVGQGWHSILKTLGEDLTRILDENPGKSIEVLQVKEKFGGLRVYLAEGGPEISAVDDLVHAAEVLSNRTCEACGAPGTPRTPLGSRYGWVQTLCPEHHAERDEEKRKREEDFVRRQAEKAAKPTE